MSPRTPVEGKTPVAMNKAPSKTPKKTPPKARVSSVKKPAGEAPSAAPPADRAVENGLRGELREPSGNALDLRQLTAAAAHEIRNPLNTMAIHCELLESRLLRLPPGPDREAALKSVATLTREVERIDRTLANFLRHAGPHEVERAPIDAAAWLAGLVTMATPLAAEADVALQLVIDAPLGRWDVDGESLGRALLALLDNAIAASPPRAAVQLSARSDGEYAYLEVRDHGTGMTPEIRDRMFHLGSTTRPGHSGLGLAIAKQVIKSQHGGDLRVETAPGQGTTMRVQLPLETDE